MKKILFFSIILSLFVLISGFLIIPQKVLEEDYNTSWKKVEKHVNDGLPKSALTIVDAIYQKAKSEGNQPQQIKSLIYRVSLQSRFKEDHLINAIQTFEAELEIANTPEKEVLESLLAELYQGYYQQNRWAINGRTTVEGVDDKDIHTWDAVRLNKKIKNYYLQSLTNKITLQQVSLNAYSAILQEADPSQFMLWPSLYDLLANRALDYFSGHDVEITAVDNLTTSDSKLLPLEDFLHDKSYDSDSSNIGTTLQLYAHLLDFHLKSEHTEALVDLDLNRLQYVYDHAMNQESELQNYLDILESMSQQYKENPVYVKIATRQAKLYISQSGKYAASVGDDYRWEKNKAEKICTKTIELYPKEKATDGIRNMLAEIRKKSFSFQLASANLPNQPFLALLNFSNTEKLFFKIVAVDPDEDRKSREIENEKSVMLSYLKVDPIARWNLDLPDSRDHQEHSTEIRIPQLNKGYYVVFVSDDVNFATSSNLAYQAVWISSLSYISKPNESEGNNELFVLDRETGDKIADVKITVYEKVYDNRNRGYKTQVVGQFNSDQDGYVVVSNLGERRYGSYLLALEKDGDQLYSENYFSFYSRTENNKPYLQTYLFTDRAIYRPGQTVYFKGIMVEKVGKEVKIKTELPTEVEFLNTNRKQIGKQTFVSNEFGSFHGSFVIPTGGLNGQMTIKNKNGSVSVQVEEYKRPTFQVLFDTIKGQYKLKDEISVNGQAEDFAGSNLTSADVKYRVTRQALLPKPYYYYRNFDIPWPVFQAETEIAHGTTQTLADGTFQFVFEALPDLRFPAKLSAAFHYRVYVEVTDITGEVRTATTNIEVGAASIKLNLASAANIDRDNPVPLTLKANNLSGAAVDITAKVSIFKLVPPDRILNKRLWKSPDLHTISEAEFTSDFPHAIYKNEGSKFNWQKSKLHTKSIPVSGQSSLFATEIKTMDVGEYFIEAEAVDSYGDTVKAVHFFTLYAGSGKNMPGNQSHWSALSKNITEPGDIIKLMAGSAAKKTKVLYEIVNGKELIERNWIVLNKGQKVIEIPVKESYRGDFSIQLSGVRFNRLYAEQFTVKVPYNNKKLDISLETHRDHLTPGKKEEWRVKIKGPEGDAAAAELLAGMYDASLDQFRSNTWALNLYHPKAQASSWSGSQFRSLSNRFLNTREFKMINIDPQRYPEINWFGYYFYHGGRQLNMNMMETSAKASSVEGIQMADEDVEREEQTVAEGNEPKPIEEEAQKEETVPPLRTNFNETAFFYPDLKTDSAGNTLFSFTTPDALTEWKVMMLTHSKDLKTGTLVQNIKAQKELMILPNVPRFVRQGDQLVFSAKIVNFTDKEMEVSARIEFLDAVSMKTVNIFTNGQRKSTKTQIAPKQNKMVSWSIDIPDNLSMLAYRIKASSETFSDGEERMFPVLTNRILVTETLPMPINGNETKSFRFDKLVISGMIAGVSTRKDFRYTVEFTSNPAWYAVQALPFLSEGNRENTSALFNRYFANTLSSYIANSNPTIQSVFESWKQLTPDAFLSNLQKNEELKNAVLNATPWVLEAEDETEQKRRIGILFDLNRLTNEQQTTLDKLAATQLSSGAWPWFNGMLDDRYTTQRIVLGLAKLNDKGVVDIKSDRQQMQMLRKAVNYLDRKVKEDFDKLKKNNPDGLGKNHLSSSSIQYLYGRTLLIEQFPLPAKTKEAFDYYTGQAKKYWLQQNNLLQGMIAISLNRLSHRNEAEGIIRSLRERSLHSDEMGMYWRQENGWNWFQAPVETQAMMIEVFSEIGNQPKRVEQMKIWLLKQKQTQQWKTSSATAEAVFVLLMNGTDLLSNNELVEVIVGDEKLDLANSDIGVEAGTGYFKTNWQASEIKAEMGNIKVTNPNTSIAWGAAYWQYFENMDRVTAHDSPLSLEKKLFIEELTDEGPVIRPVEDGQKLNTGDKVFVRLIIRTDRNMEFVHLKDMRATAFEPLKSISGYNYKGGLGYYENITDVSTDFFMRYLHKGTYVLEYPLHVTQTGSFSNGIATIQSMYAPEFGAHSSGLRVVVE